MFETIIVGIEGRPQDAEALALARQLADPGAEIIAIRVAVAGHDLLRTAGRSAETDRMDDAEEIVDAFTDGRSQVEGLAVESDSVGEGLRAAADGASADLIVVASSRRGLVGRIVAGDDVRDILDRAPCPVAIATVGHQGDGPLRRIVMGYDGSAAADEALAVAARLGERDGAKVGIVDVVEPSLAIAAMTGAYLGNALDDEYARARSNLDRVKHQYGLPGVIATGKPGHELAEASRGSDLLAIGLHHHDWLERVIVGSAGSSVLGDRSASLLVVPKRPAVATVHVADALDTIPSNGSST